MRRFMRGGLLVPGNNQRHGGPTRARPFSRGTKQIGTVVIGPSSDLETTFASYSVFNRQV